jgi:prevent-host-death family protein
MPKTYSIAEARAHLSDVIEDVEAYQAVQLTRRGRPIAVVLSQQQYERLRAERTDFGEAYRAFAARHPRGGVGLDSDFFTSLRDRKPGRRVRL